ncbi:hypothetical protein GCK72_020969 [Caenorhabditis remanei]|uniref:BTB domain-containing protein n=1 Tax=Caenorhabditis remanei TaxID=31234 RepID=A0A6A5GGQ6_CAERE|nr:hypothetical protein GCK72_020969 [Caenorhabditis remanei]KAF1754408.1 hypothetical protein GCK72_020969 [Caenorhabditis remanei]
MSQFESNFAQTDKTDAILLVDGRKLHINKALLSYHSDYFKNLFKWDFKEKSIPEFKIDDVDFEEFATLLSLIQENPIMPTEDNAENILELAERFLLPTANRHVELFLISTTIHRFEKIRIADKYRLMDLMDHGIQLFQNSGHFQYLKNATFYKNLADETKAKMTVYESTFAQSDKTDAILVVKPEEDIDSDEEYESAALLSHHSDYFKEMFDADSGIKSPREFLIEDVNFEDFATLLSLVHESPITFQESAAERLLKLAYQFQLPAAKHHVELFLMASSSFSRDSKFQLADKYNLETLLKSSISNISSVWVCPKESTLKGLSDKTNVRIFHRLIDLE